MKLANPLFLKAHVLKFHKNNAEYVCGNEQLAKPGAGGQPKSIKKPPKKRQQINRNAKKVEEVTEADDGNGDNLTNKTDRYLE